MTNCKLTCTGVNNVRERERGGGGGKERERGGKEEGRGERE